MNRRGFFFGSAAIITTPGLLMPTKKLIVPSQEIFHLEPITTDEGLFRFVQRFPYLPVKDIMPSGDIFKLLDDVWNQCNELTEIPNEYR